MPSCHDLFDVQVRANPFYNSFHEFRRIVRPNGQRHTAFKLLSELWAPSNCYQVKERQGPKLGQNDALLAYLAQQGIITVPPHLVAGALTLPPVSPKSSSSTKLQTN